MRCAIAIVFAATTLASAAPVSFSRDIRSILSNSCYQCHGPDSKQRKAGLRLDEERDSRVELKSGARAVVPCNLEESELVHRITTNDEDDRMPPLDFKKQLSKKQIDLLRQWVREGGDYEKHWSYIPPKAASLPRVKQTSWPHNAIDHFVLKRLEDEGLKPSPEVDKATLLLRVTFDLTGLRPSLAELNAFLADDSPDAYQKVVDRLLASPRYGEHLGRYWLDAARYADTNGYQYDTHRDMWPWRDWVINAYNRNLPFDQFTIEQLAGDLLPNATLDQKIATGFNRNHPITIEGGVIDEEYRTEYVIDRVTTTAQVWMGLSFICARCHDHKYDPIPQKEFYQFFAFFNQVPEKGNSGFSPKIKVPPSGLAHVQTKLAAVQEKLDAQETLIAAAQTEWGKKLKINPSTPVWSVIKPTKITGGEGTAFTPLPDLSTLAGGKSPVNEIYDILLQTKETGITAIRLECLKHESLPHGGAGRAFNSNFVLSEFELEISSPDKEQKPERIKFRQAVADYSQNNFNIAASIDGNKGTGWAVDGPTKKENRIAMYLAEKPFGHGTGANMRIRMHFNYPNIVHAIGRFRFAISTDPMPKLKLGESLPDVAALPTAKRTPQQKKRLRRLFLSTDAPPKIKEPYVHLQKLQAEIKRLQTQSISTMVMQDMPNPRKTHLLFRGKYDKKREEVTAGTPAFLPSMPNETPMNRLGLARWLVSKKHPLTARVAVNREWQRLFGIGIVKTTEEFGAQGDWPSHPKLLDWLAVHFMNSGWDTKALLKFIVTSATYRQSSSATPELLVRDQANLLLARGPRHRLDAEIVRDNALAVSGLLVEKIGGPSVFPYHPKGLWQELNNRPNYSRTYKQDKGEKLYRRSLYTYWKRTVPPPSMATFDAPEREFCLVRRSRTNTPLQAFVMLHDPQFVEAARHLAERMMSASDNPDGCIEHGFRLATSRLPNNKEKVVLHQLFRERLLFYLKDKKAAKAVLSVGESIRKVNLSEPEQAAWTTVARALLNLSETISKN